MNDDIEELRAYADAMKAISDRFADVVTNRHSELEVCLQIIKAMNAPKRVVRDAEGRISHVETVNE